MQRAAERERRERGPEAEKKTGRQGLLPPSWPGWPPPGQRTVSGDWCHGLGYVSPKGLVCDGGEEPALPGAMETVLGVPLGSLVWKTEAPCAGDARSYTVLRTKQRLSEEGREGTCRNECVVGCLCATPLYPPPRAPLLCQGFVEADPNSTRQPT